MTGILTLSRFSGRFGSLNGTLTLTATRADFIRSLLTVGYPSRRAAIRTVGRWREEMLVAMATGYLDHNLHTTTYFRNLEQTEKAAVSFLFGEAFTHWCAQDRMNIEYLVHVAGLRSCTWGAATTPVTPKPGALPPAPKSRPDFIGIRRTERHVFESKGRIRRPSTATVNKALGQVSALHSINGRPPTTRCASFFMMKASGPEGKVVDPPKGGEGISVRFDEHEAIARAYAFFLDGDGEGFGADVGAGYVGREIDDGVFLGVDRQVLSLVSERPPNAFARRRRINELFAMLENKAQFYAARRDREASPGPDGLLLIDRRPRFRSRS